MVKIFSWNVNGIRAVVRKDTLGPFIRAMEPDILCLQETKAEQEQSEIDLKDYHEFWFSAKKKGYSGTAIFSKMKPLSIINGLPDNLINQFKVKEDLYGNPNQEGRVITAEYQKFFVISVYTPNAKDDLGRLVLRHKQWDPAFLAYTKQLEKKKPVIFCGDLNVAHTSDDLARPKENEGKKGYTKEEREGFQNFLDEGFIDSLRLFKKGSGYYTWWTHWANARARNVGWRIDYIMVSSSLKDKIKAADIHVSTMGSDHCPISVTMDI
jgi:exodeoxyribonuclease-3